MFTFPGKRETGSSRVCTCSALAAQLHAAQHDIEFGESSVSTGDVVGDNDICPFFSTSLLKALLLSLAVGRFTYLLYTTSTSHGVAPGGLFSRLLFA